MRQSIYLFCVTHLAFVAAGCGSPFPPEQIVRLGPFESQVALATHDDAFSVMTLNLAHGRNQALHQIFVSAEKTRDNLDAVVELLEANRPDVLGCQEADGPSFWSGGFSHVYYLASQAEFGWFLRGEHVKAANLSYGTALLSRLPMQQANVHTFGPTPMVARKGFTASTVAVGGRRVKVISVHLDFSSERSRLNQVREMISIFEDERLPLVLMGDFNTDWDGESLRRLSDALGVRPYEPENDTLITFGAQKRLDWILISQELAFETHAVLDAEVSDHRAVLAELRFREQSEFAARSAP